MRGAVNKDGGELGFGKLMGVGKGSVRWLRCTLTEEEGVGG